MMKKQKQKKLEAYEYPLVSIITVVRNGQAYIQRCIDSVLAQSYPNIEHVIIDGASTDDTIDILKKNTHQIAFWLSEVDKGIYDAMNKAISYVNGEWILFLGSDDILLPGFSEMAYQLNERSAIYYGRVICQGKIQYGEVDQDTLALRGIAHQAIFYPACIFTKKHYRFNIQYVVYADYILNLQCWQDPEIKFQFYDIVISDFNYTGVSSTVEDHLFSKNRNGLIRRYLGSNTYYRYRWTLFKEKIKRKINKRVKMMEKLLTLFS